MKKNSSVFIYSHGPHKSSRMLAKRFGIKTFYFLKSPKVCRPYLTVLWSLFAHIGELRKYNLFFLEGMHLVFLTPFLPRKSKIIIKGNDQVPLHIENKFVWRLFFGFFKLFIPRSRIGVLAVSELMRNKYRELLNLKALTVEGFIYRDINTLGRIEPDFNSGNFIFIGKNSYFKGVDLTVRVFLILKARGTVKKNSKLYLIGGHKEYVEDNLKISAEKLTGKGVEFIGETDDIERYMADSLFQIHLARYEPNAVAVMEGMAAGLIPFVSENTGNKTFIQKIEPELIMKNENPDEIAGAIDKFLSGKNSEELKILSESFKEKSRIYSAREGLDRWFIAWDNLTREL